jgi:hypothetical protein
MPASEILPHHPHQAHRSVVRVGLLVRMVSLVRVPQRVHVVL